MLSPDDRHLLLRIAFDAVEREVHDRGQEDVSIRGGVLGRQGGAFVTLYINKELRGCIGFIQPSYPLWKTVQTAAVKAAREDFRFRPIRAAELDDLAIQISLIGPMRQMRAPEDIRIGTDGVIIDYQGMRGLLLPQVAQEWRFDARQFLEAVCGKACLPRDSWMRPDAVVTLFDAEIIGGKEREIGAW